MLSFHPDKKTMISILSVGGLVAALLLLGGVLGGVEVDALLLVGILVGALAIMILVWKLMPGMMITVHESKFNSVRETCEQLQQAIQKNDWHSPAVRNMNKTVAKHGYHLDKEVCVVELCKAPYAQKVLTTNPEVSTLMPCAWGVYKHDDGRVLISGMNTGLMGKMFGGVIADVMGEKVGSDEKLILQQVTRN